VKHTYYATFIPGLREYIEEIIKERLPEAAIQRLLDGAVIFETETSYDKLNFFCFNNIFAVISVMEHTENRGALELHIKAALKNSDQNAARETIALNNKKIQSFRIIVSDENRPAAVDAQLRAEAERYISRLSGFTVNRAGQTRAGQDTEFWFLYRSEGGLPGTNGRTLAGLSVFMKRLTLRTSWEKSLHPGELPPPLAWMLCHIAALRHGDTVLDPFCGYGSIPAAALKYFHISKFIACDNNSKAAAYTKNRHKNLIEERFLLHQAEFDTLPLLIPEKSIDAIVTDPPWGLFREITDNQFYEKMFRVFGSLFKEEGRAVLLCARQDELINAAGSFELKKTVPILLSGKKAAIFQFVKKLHGGMSR